MNNRTEEAVLTAYHHYNSKAKNSDLACWKNTAKDLWVAYKELQAYHKLRNTMFPNIEEADNEVDN